MKRADTAARRSALAAFVIATLAAQAAAEEPAPAADDETAQNCVSLHAIRSTRVLDDRTILFEMHGRKMLVNRLPRRCPSLGFEKRFAYKTSLSRLCNTDIITVLTDFGRGASCGLGMFETWVPPDPDADKPGEAVLEPVETE